MWTLLWCVWLPLYTNQDSSLSLHTPHTHTHTHTHARTQFMGPTLYNTNHSFLVNSLGSKCTGTGNLPLPGENNDNDPSCFLLHFDMLHESPLCMGIVHDPETATPYGHVYWAFDGLDAMLMRYDFERPHMPCIGYVELSTVIIYIKVKYRVRQMIIHCI